VTRRTNRRRPKGEGSIRERSPGVWQLRLKHGDRLLARTVRGTRKDATEELARLRLDADRLAAQPIEAATATVGDLIKAWWESPTVAAPGSPKSENSLTAASAALRNWIGPYLGHIRLSRLTARDIERMVAAMQAKRLKPTSVQRYLATLNTMLNQAVAWDWIDVNPRSKATVTAVKRKQVEPPSTHAVELILRRLDDGWHGPHADTLPVLVRLLALSGIRRGEACGLQWGDVNWTAGHIVVQRNISQSTRSGIVVGPTKNKRPRVVPLEPDMMDRLNALYQKRAAEGPVEKGRWVFGRDGGRKVLTPNALAAAYAEVPEAVGVRLNLHGFRHWHATHLLDQGIPVRSVQERLGHTAASITLNIYAHPVDSTARLASQRISELVNELTAPKELASAAPSRREPPGADGVDVDVAG
jgi:integrase